MAGNSKEQKAGVTTLISNKVAFHTQRMIKDEVCHFMMMNLTRKIESFLTWMHLSNLSCSLLLQCHHFCSVLHRPLGCHQAPPQFILPSAASVALLPFRWLLVIKPQALGMMCPYRCSLLCAVPTPFYFCPVTAVTLHRFHQSSGL